MATKLILSLLDINSNYSEYDNYNDSNQQKIESPDRIANDYLTSTVKTNFTKDNDKEFETLYQYNSQIVEGSTTQIMLYVEKDLSFIPEVILNSDAYVVFCNLEDSETYEKLDKMFDFLNDSGSFETLLFIVGVYSRPDKILENLSSDNINNNLRLKGMPFKYYNLLGNFSKDYFAELSKQYNNNKFYVEEPNITIKKILLEIYKHKLHKTGGGKVKFKADPGKSGCNLL